jgi:anion-transporting  ArsA/GET3 family ATPase
VIADLAERRMVVCCGAGGVGKTTLSAAIALGLARRGSRVAVVTIDPARRLATALGMDDLSDEPQRVHHAAVGPGEMWALQLDAKATFDRLVARHAPDDAARERIMQNRIYRHLSSAVAGSQEYMAVERLHELVDEGSYDRIVLDTPPAQNALDFLDAPQRITRFIEGKALRMLVRPGLSTAGAGWRVLHLGSSTILSVLERITGGQMLRDVSEFLAGFDGMYQGFADRAQAVRALLASPESAFVVISAPGTAPLRQAMALGERLRADGLPLAGAVLNRVHPLPPGGAPGPRPLLDALVRAGVGDAGSLAARMAATVAEEQIVALSDLDAHEALRAALPAVPLTTVPALDDEPADIAGLAAVADALDI